MGGNAYRWVMTAADAPFRRVEFTPAARPGQVVVAVAGCGVCHTDLGYYYDGVRTNGELPLALGHEIAGRVVEAGPGAETWLDRPVVIPAVIPCGQCDLCVRGRGTICRQQKMPGNDIHGGFASHIEAPAHGLCEVDPQRLAAAGLSLAEVSVLADALTTPYQAAIEAGVQPGDLAVVVGVGGVGGYCVQVCAALGARVVAIDIDDARLAACSDHGASLTLNAAQSDARALKKAVAAFAREQGLRGTEWKIFECSGSTAGQATAYGLLVHGAHLAVVGFTMGKLELRLSNLMAFHARAQGNWGCLPEHYPRALDLVLDGRVAMKPFVELHPLHRINEVFEAAHAHRLEARAILVPDAD